MNLNELEIGQSAVIKTVGGEGHLRQHFLDMSVIPGIEIKLVKLAPMGDPMEFTLHGYELTLRLADAEKITVEPVAAESQKPFQKIKKKDIVNKHSMQILPKRALCLMDEFLLSCIRLNFEINLL